jgi:hypothetical protein
MKDQSFIFAIVVLVLWLGTLTYIAAPQSIIQKLPTPPMGAVPSAFLGVLLFLLSIVVITFWGAMSSDNPVIEEVKASEIKP